MELYAAGFNAHGQLLSPPADLPTFQKIASGTTIRILCAVFCATVLVIDDLLHFRGFHDSGITNAVISGLPPHKIRSVFGDTSGILGALTTAGEIWTFAAQGGGLGFVRQEVPLVGWLAREGVVIDHIAVADNDQVCLSTRPSQPPQTPTPTPTILTFPSFATLLTAHTPLSTHPLPTPLTTLLGSSTSFTALPSPPPSYFSSPPLTWGDPRHLHLGRAPTPLSPASAPAPVLALDGIPVAKVVARGWLSAALSRERDVYLWGGRLGTRERGIGAERETPASESAQAGDERDIPASQSRSEDEDDIRLLHTPAGADVADVAVGDGWVVIVTAGGEVWGRGEGGWGQLGAGRSGWEGGWVEGRIEGWEEEGGRIEGSEEGWERRAQEGKGEGRMEKGVDGNVERGGGKRIVGVEGGVWNCFLLVKV